jgi:hypothetical protein
MSRSKRNNGNNRRSNRAGPSSPTRNAQEQVLNLDATEGMKTPDHDLTVMGSSNINRAFAITDYSNGPSIVYRTQQPFLAYYAGFSGTASGGIDVGDSNAATNTATSDPTTPLYPVTKYAEYQVEDAWPILENLFSSGTGQRYPITVAEFTRYNAMLMRAYEQILPILTINYLTYHFDWSSIFPFSEAVPQHLYDLATSYDATDVGLASTWLPIMKRFESKIMFPRIQATIKRFAYPMLSVDFNGRLQMGWTKNLFSTDLATVHAEILSYLDYIDTNLKSASAVISSFIPFPMSDMDLWNFEGAPVIDIDRDTGWFNSGQKDANSFNDTFDPTDLTNTMFVHPLNDPTGAPNITWYSRHTQPVWAELQCATVFELFTKAVDDDYSILSPHFFGQLVIPDDNNSFIVYDGTTYDSTDNEYYYGEFANCRYVMPTKVSSGVQRPGYLGSSIPYDAYRRLVRLQAEYDWNNVVLKDITRQMAGASIREIRYAIKYLAVEGTRSER